MKNGKNNKNMFDVYRHHQEFMWVEKSLKGKHANHCLCWSCANFIPDDREKNCPIANVLFAIDCAMNVVTPVWECAEFVEDIEAEG